MNYWIFVHTGINADKTFLQLLELKNWGFESTRPIKNRINELQKGDVVVFYLGGVKGKYLSGEARLTSNAHTPTRESVGGPKYAKLDSMVDFDNIDLWNGQKIYVSDPYIRQKLGFIKNKNNWGMTFGKSIVSITETDYNAIKDWIKQPK